MDVAALVISIFAILLSVIVAGWAIYLQWSMFKATTDQLVAIGKENASLGQRIARSLGRLQETATTTRSRLDTTLDQLVSGLLGRAAPSAEEPSAVDDVQLDRKAWAVGQAMWLLQDFSEGRAILEYFEAGVRPSAAVESDLAALAPKDEDPGDWEAFVLIVLGILRVLDLLRLDGDSFSLTVEGRQLAERLREVAGERESSAAAKDTS